MNKYKDKLKKNSNKKLCPHCGSKEIGIDNWGMFEGDRDWFYYCKECDFTFMDGLNNN